MISKSKAVSVAAGRPLRWSRLALVLVAGCVPWASPAAAGHGGCGCSSHTGAVAGPCCQPRPNGPIFKTLDTLAGGIETVLQKTVLNCNASLFPSRSVCRTQSCDDACDAIAMAPYGDLAAPAALHRSAPHSSLVPLPPEDNFVQPLEPLTTEPSVLPRRQGIPSLLPSSPQPSSSQSSRPSQADTTTEQDFMDSFAPPSSEPGNRGSDPFRDDPQTRRYQRGSDSMMLQGPAPLRAPARTASFPGR